MTLLSDTIAIEMQANAARLVDREIYLNVSPCVSTLAGAAHLTAYDPHHKEMADATEQAMELASPIPDYEQAARDAGWQPGKVGNVKLTMWGKTDASASYESVEDLCGEEDIEPYDREVYEFWAVSNWLADRLVEQGEKVDRDFLGWNWNVWARTTTGQAISIDCVIEAITAELHNPKAEA